MEGERAAGGAAGIATVDMAHDRPTDEPPTAMGWYVAWHPHDDGRPRPSVYFCVAMENGKVSCMNARPADGEDFRPITHEQFARALWHGPFKTRTDASARTRPRSDEDEGSDATSAPPNS